jgi:hypothetical protein
MMMMMIAVVVILACIADANLAVGTVTIVRAQT